MRICVCVCVWESSDDLSISIAHNWIIYSIFVGIFLSPSVISNDVTKKSHKDFENLYIIDSD